MVRNRISCNIFVFCTFTTETDIRGEFNIYDEH